MASTGGRGNDVDAALHRPQEAVNGGIDGCLAGDRDADRKWQGIEECTGRHTRHFESPREL